MYYDKRFETICKEIIPDLETLEDRYVDDLDFHDINVSALRKIMNRAYQLGKEDTLRFLYGNQNSEKGECVCRQEKKQSKN